MRTVTPQVAPSDTARATNDAERAPVRLAGWDEVQTDAFAGQSSMAARPGVPYQEDYLFASPALAERLRRCVAFNPTGWYAFSDHSPIVATFED